MPRKASLVPKTSRINVKRNNGDIYVYERITKYNPQKHFNEVVSSQLIGKKNTCREYGSCPDATTPQ